MSHFKHIAIFIFLRLLLCFAKRDGTLQPQASGSGITETTWERVRSKCIFSDDKLFMRRLAYVESQDGLDGKTFRPGYDGGIWQVKRSIKNDNKTI